MLYISGKEGEMAEGDSKGFFEAIKLLPKHYPQHNTGKICPVCNADYLKDKVARVPKTGLEITHCVDCGAVEVWAVLPLCWCGSVIRPRDRFCSREGHMVCRYGCAPCPGWHDYSNWFIEE
jgi:hypothetical protein